MTLKMKKVVSSLLVMALMLSFALPVKAAEPQIIRRSPAPELSKIEVTDIAFDDTDSKGTLYAVVTYTGRPRNYRCVCNGHECSIDTKDSYTTFSNGMETGMVVYFKTQYTLHNISGVQVFQIQAFGSTQRVPYQTLSALRFFDNPYYGQKI